MSKQTNPTRIYREVSVDDFLRDPILNEKRIKAYKDIAKDYNVSESTIRDVFMLGINFTIANMDAIEIQSEEEIDIASNRYYFDLEEKREKAKNFKGQVAGRHPDNLTSREMYAAMFGFVDGASFILNYIKGNNHEQTI